MRRIYWDPTVFEAIAGGKVPHAEVGRDSLRRIKAGEATLIIPYLAMAELAMPDWSEQTQKQIDQILEDAFASEYVIPYCYTREIGRVARELVREGMNPRDAHHIATALDAKCEFYECVSTLLEARPAVRGMQVRRLASIAPPAPLFERAG